MEIKAKAKINYKMFLITFLVKFKIILINKIIINSINRCKTLLIKKINIIRIFQIIKLISIRTNKFYNKLNRFNKALKFKI